jgi:hypothetical protein
MDPSVLTRVGESASHDARDQVGKKASPLPDSLDPKREQPLRAV